MSMKNLTEEEIKNGGKFIVIKWGNKETPYAIALSHLTINGGVIAAGLFWEKKAANFFAKVANKYRFEE